MTQFEKAMIRLGVAILQLLTADILARYPTSPAMNWLAGEGERIKAETAQEFRELFE